MLFRRICGTLVHNSSVISLSKTSGWFYRNLHHYEQIACISSPTVYIFNQTVASSSDEIDRRVHHFIYIYIYIYIWVWWSYRWKTDSHWRLSTLPKLKNICSIIYIEHSSFRNIAKYINIISTYTLSNVNNHLKLKQTIFSWNMEIWT